jgi:hypothetical protein
MQSRFINRPTDPFCSYRDLKNVAPYEDEGPPAVLFHEFLLMLLYVDLDNVQRFAGKHGEVEARRAYALLETWAMDEQSRNAVCHAGQVLRAGRAVPQYGLRGFEAIALYQATLVLWVYGVLQCAVVPAKSSKEKAGQNHPVPSTVSASNEFFLPRQNEGDKRVLLDGPVIADVKRYVELGQGAPGLSLERGINQTDKFCDLRNSQSVMAVGVSVLESNYTSNSGKEKNLPPLPGRLRDLMQALGALPDVQVT